MESATLRVRLFGALEIRQGDTPLPSLESARAESLLAYLLLHREAPQPRQRLAFLLWPDSTESQARTNLRHLLHTLRNALPDIDRFLAVTPRTLQWRSDVPLWLDVAVFNEAMARADRDGADETSALREAVELYAGDMLENLYDEWMIDERERLRAQRLDALERLTVLLEARGNVGEAIRYADMLLRLDPIREDTYRQLMRLYDARGDRARALHVYHVCAATLERELGVEPSAATVEAYEALLTDDRQPFDSKRQERRLGGPPLIGRRLEWSCLTSLWRATDGRRAQFVLVTGEAGIGKTRLIEEFRSWCVHRGAIAAEGRSYAAEGALSYGQVTAWLRSEGIHTRLERLDQASLAELARVLPELRAVGVQPEPLSEADQRQRLFDAAARAICTPGNPVLLVADDLQWCDRESLQFLHYLIRARPDVRLLVAATARSEDIDDKHPLQELLAGLHALDRCTEIQLDRLTPAETGVLAEHIIGRPVAERDLESLYAETEGSPLFVVETLRAGWLGGSIAQPSISPKVQAAITARLAQLSEPARNLVGFAATIGRAFPTDVLAEAAEVDADALVRALDELWRRRIIREQGAGAYDFSHDKIREGAYLGLSPARRSQAHLRVARALESRHAHNLGQVSGELAAHYERAGLTDQAITWYGRAAETALELNTNHEAVRLLDRALELLRTLPETPERQTKQLALLESLPTPLGVVEGWSSERTAAAHERALSLSRAIGVEPSSPLLRSLAIASLTRRDFATARDYGERLRVRGEHNANNMLLVEADYVLGIAAFWQGEFVSAQTHFESAVTRYVPEHRRAHLLHYGLDPKVICLSRLGNTLWILGYPESATRARDEALAFAGEINHPYSLGVALVFAIFLSLEMREIDAMRAYLETLTALRGASDTKTIENAIQLFDGYLSVLDGRSQEGIAGIQQALAEVEAADRAPGQRALIMRLLVEACAIAGDVRAGLAAADAALASSDAGRLFEAEIRRHRAEFLGALGAPDAEVERELERALAVARRQSALMYELRSAISLLRHHRGRNDDRGTRTAYQCLEAIVARLPKDQESRERQEAVSLLSQN